MVKIITDKTNNKVLHVYDDHVELQRYANYTKVMKNATSKKMLTMLVGAGFSDTNIYINVDLISNFVFGKHMYDGSSWSADNNFKGSTNLIENLTDSDTEIFIGQDVAFFENSGTVKIMDEQITYTNKTSNKLIGCTRGANSTTATAHNGVLEVKQI